MNILEAVELEFEKMKEEDEYFRKHRKEIEYVYSLADVNKCFQGPLQYVSKSENIKLCEDFFKKYYPEEAKDISFDLKTSLYILTDEDLKRIISREADLNEYPPIAYIHADELKDTPALLATHACWGIILRECDTLEMAFYLVHEYTHKIYYEKGRREKDNSSIKDEALAKYNELLFRDYLKNTKYQQEANLISSIHKNELLWTMVITNDCYKIKNKKGTIEESHLELIARELFEERFFFAEDYSHDLGYVLATELYNQDISLEEKADKLLDIMSDDKAKPNFKNKTKVKSLVRNILQIP